MIIVNRFEYFVVGRGFEYNQADDETNEEINSDENKTNKNAEAVVYLALEEYKSFNNIIRSHEAHFYGIARRCFYDFAEIKKATKVFREIILSAKDFSRKLKICEIG